MPTMLTAAFFNWIAVLYYFCSLLLVALVIFIIHTGRRRARLRRLFLLLALCLFLWQLTLFAEVRTPQPWLQLVLARVNFTVMVLAPALCLRFVQEIPRSRRDSSPVQSRWWDLATGALALVTLFTPWIDESETVVNGQAISTYGPLFPLYLLHVMGYWSATVIVASRECRRATKQETRDQLTLIAAGILVTGSVAFITNALLPYVWNDFRFCDLGTLSSLGFLLSVAYATLVLRLFNLRSFVRRTLIYGLLLGGVLGIYSSTVFIVTQTLTDNASKITQFAVLMLAFSFDPIRRFLEKKTDEWLFENENDHPGVTRPVRKKRAIQENEVKRQRSRLPPLSLLFPWR